MELFSGKSEVPWNFMEFQGTWEYGKRSMKFHGTVNLEKIQWNSLELDIILLKIHEIPWNHRCYSNFVRKLPWNSWESLIELFDQKKFQLALKIYFEWYFDT